MHAYKEKKGLSEKLIGITLIIIAFGITAYNFWISEQARINSEQSYTLLNEYIQNTQRNDTVSSDASLDHQMDTLLNTVEYTDYAMNPLIEMPTMEINKQDYIGVLSIPDLNLRLPILADYVYENLHTAPCRFQGSAYEENFVICAHNYASHFGTLHNLSLGAAISFEDISGNIFKYEVEEILTLSPTEPTEFVQSGYDLTLFTCTVGGASRVVVRCSKMDI
ncbi:MAG: sortase [Lachnospiraceae bacterium]